MDLARRLEWTTTYAHQLLRAGFDHTAASEDESDSALLREVEGLDAADRNLPAKVEAYERERGNGDTGESARRAILNTLDAIDERYSAVVRAVRPRQTHEALHHALSATPVLIEELRERVILRLN